MKPGEINHGFDPTEAEPWTSVGVGSTNEIVQLFIYDPYTEYVSNIVLVVRASDTNNVSVTQTNGFTDGDNPLTIIGKEATSNATIEVRVQGMTNAIAALHVMVLPWITNSIGIYRIVDTNSPGTSPVGGPAATNIIATLNSVYTQACVHFTLATNLDMHISYDLFRDGKLEEWEKQVVRAAITNHATWSEHRRVHLLRRSANSKEFGFARVGFPWAVAFTHDTGLNLPLPTNLVLVTVAHEVGHQLGLSTRNDLQPDGKRENHDLGTPPSGTAALMRQYWDKPPPPPEPRWMRHDDWKKANLEAEARTR